MDNILEKIAIIPSRSGSKRIPLKSLEKIGDHTLLARTIRTVIGLEKFDKVVVWTDSQIMADEALKHGAEVPFLRTKFADDISPVSVTTLDCVERLDKVWELSSETIVCQFMPNCPFMSASSINKMLQFFRDHQCESLLTCVRTDPIYRFIFELNEFNVPQKLILDTPVNARTQDFKPSFIPSGALWLTKYGTLKKFKSYYTQTHQFFEIPVLEGFDIDTFEQLELARFLAQKTEG